MATRLLDPYERQDPPALSGAHSFHRWRGRGDSPPPPPPPSVDEEGPAERCERPSREELLMRLRANIYVQEAVRNEGIVLSMSDEDLAAHQRRGELRRGQRSPLSFEHVN